MNEVLSLGIIILAAGGSKRLGQPKQLLKYKNTTLLQNIIDIVNEINADEKILILGSNVEEIRKNIDKKNVKVHHNKLWETGVSTSIKLGLEMTLKNNPSIENIMFLLSDQPFIEKELITNLINLHKTNDFGMTCCNYNGILGVPAIFNKKYFNEINELTLDVGAKKILNKYKDKVLTINFEKGLIDIDTKDDYKKLINSNI